MKRHVRIGIAVSVVILIGGVRGMLSAPVVARTNRGSPTAGDAALARSIREGNAFDERTLVSRGFQFDVTPRERCTISGGDGPCQVDAFIWGERSHDPFANTCSKLNKASYRGDCVAGLLEGVCVVIADGDHKVSREAFLAYFSRGRIAYPALTSYVQPRDGVLDLGVRERSRSYGCVYFGEWDHTDRFACPRMKDIYGDDILSEESARALRDDTFDLAKVRENFARFMTEGR